MLANAASWVTIPGPSVTRSVHRSGLGNGPSLITMSGPAGLIAALERVAEATANHDANVAASNRSRIEKEDAIAAALAAGATVKQLTVIAKLSRARISQIRREAAGLAGDDEV